MKARDAVLIVSRVGVGEGFDVRLFPRRLYCHGALTSVRDQDIEGCWMGTGAVHGVG